MTNACLLFAIHNGNTLLRRVSLTQNVIRIGNDPRSQLRVDDPAVARMHAVIEAGASGDVTLIDLGNEPGTLVNGLRVDKCRLTIGDELTIGNARLVFERNDVQGQSVVAAATQVHPERVVASPINSFFGPDTGSSLSFRRAETVDDDAPPDSYTYAMVKSGPDVSPEEVELVNVPAVEVMVLWGRNVLHVAHLAPGKDFYVGEEQGRNLDCDYFIPKEKLGTTRMPVIVQEQGCAYVVIPPGANGHVEVPGRPSMTLDEVRRNAQPSARCLGAHQLALLPGAKVRIELADFVFRIGAVNAGKPVKKGLAAGLDWAAFSYFGMSFGAVGALVSAMAFFMPTLADSADDSISQDQLYLMQQYLVAAAEREQDQKPTEALAEEHADNKEGGTGTRAKHEEGSMGTPSSRAKDKRYAVKGDKENPDPHLARLAAVRDAQTFGLIGLLNSGAAGDPNAPTAPWGQDESRGTDEVSFRGNMWGDELGEASGSGGLGLSGLGEGGGGRGEGVGLGTFGALGHGAGPGAGHGRLGGSHRVRPPSRMRPGITEVSGRLPPEVIQRIVRQNYGRFRMCYEQGLARNPNLEGRVQVRFAIDREGMVSNVQNGGSDLPDSAVTNCIIGAYYGLSFPHPEGGIVTVVYPIMFQPG